MTAMSKVNLPMTMSRIASGQSICTPLDDRVARAVGGELPVVRVIVRGVL